MSDDLWRISQDGLSVADAAAAVPTPLGHTVSLNAGILDTDTGPNLRANWTWAHSVLDHGADHPAQPTLVRRPHRHLRPRPTRRRRIDPLRHRPRTPHPTADRRAAAAIPRRRRLPLTPMQRGLLFHTNTAHGANGDDVYAMQLDITVTGPLDPIRLRDAVHTVANRHPHLAARFCGQFDQPIQIIPADPAAAWRYVDLAGGAEFDDQIQRVCAAERAAVCDLTDPPAFRAALIRTAEDRHRCVLTFHHIVMDGWSLPILLQEIFAGYYGHRLPAAGSYRRYVSWLDGRDLVAAHAAWNEVLAGFDTPTLVGLPGRVGHRGVESFRLPEETMRALGELARANHTTINTVLQGAWAQLLMWLTGQHDVVFGTAVSGRPTDMVGAESMVGLLINTVPVRAHTTSATTIADLLGQLQGAHSHTLDHQHLPLAEIHRITGHDQLFDTLFVYENYPIDTGAMLGTDGLAISEFTTRERNHYPLTLQAMPGHELSLRLEFDTDVFDAGTVEQLIRAFYPGAGGDDRRADPPVVVDRSARR